MPAAPVSARPPARTTTWYRTDHDRAKSLRRRVDPWYRRMARGAIVGCLLAALGAGLYVGAVAVQGYLGRDRLPSAGAEVPEIRSTSFLIRSRPPGPVVDGTLTIDTTSMAFEFSGRVGGPQAGIQVVSPNGSSASVRRSSGDWVTMTDTDPDQVPLRRQDLVRVVQYLSDDDTADAILTDIVRRHHVDLIEQTTEGLSDNERQRYDLEIDTLALSTDAPSQWQTFLAEAIPDAPAVEDLGVTIWLDANGVLVRLSGNDDNWSWERLAYSADPFVPQDPAAALLEATTGAEPATDPGVTATTAGG